MRFTYVLPWPEQFSAEKEFSFRIKAVADRLGHECLIRSADEIKAVPAEDRADRFRQTSFSRMAVPGL